MRFEDFSFGSIKIDKITYEHDVVIDRGEIRKRKKKPSKKFREKLSHTPLFAEEEIPWKCRRLVIGTGAYGNLPVMKEVRLEAGRSYDTRIEYFEDTRDAIAKFVWENSACPCRFCQPCSTPAP